MANLACALPALILSSVALSRSETKKTVQGAKGEAGPAGSHGMSGTFSEDEFDSIHLVTRVDNKQLSASNVL